MIRPALGWWPAGYSAGSGVQNWLFRLCLAGAGPGSGRPLSMPSAANRYYRLTEASPCENGGEQRDQTLVRMTHRHFAIFRTRVKPYCAYNSSGPVCR